MYAAGSRTASRRTAPRRCTSLRAEKGYIIVGQETDGTVTPDDVGSTWAIGKAKPDFVGKRALDAAAISAPGASSWSGCSPSIRDRAGGRRAGRRNAGTAPPMPLIGHVTSSYASPVLGRSIALAMVADGRARIGREAVRADAGRRIAVQVRRRCSTTPRERASMADAIARRPVTVTGDTLVAQLACGSEVRFPGQCRRPDRRRTRPRPGAPHGCLPRGGERHACGALARSRRISLALAGERSDSPRGRSGGCARRSCLIRWWT